MDLTGVARLPLLLLRKAEIRGLDRSELLSRAGIAESELADPDRRVPLSLVEKVWRVIVEAVDDPDIGLAFGQTVALRDWGLVGYTVAYSATLRQALERVQRYSRIVNEATRWEVLTHEDPAMIRSDGGPFDSLRHVVDSRLSALVSCAREATGADIVPVEVRFNYERPESTARHEEIFRCRLSFGCPKVEVLLQASDMARPVATADETLCGYLDNLAQGVLDSLGKDTLTQQVQRAIWSELSSGQPSLARTAELLNISSRTLQRRLREEGTSFGTILERFRKRMAVRLLADPGLAVYEIAFLLGYSEPSTFFRAFRRWHADSPQEYRRKSL